MLGISTSTLRTWERRYGFPRPVRSPGGHRQYALAEIEALRLTLAETHNVSSAVALARERGEGPPSPTRLAAAFANFDEERCNRLLEESLTLRSVERTIEDVLLDAVATHALAGPTPEYEFAWRHAAGWISAVRRLTPAPSRTEGILVIDDTAALSLEALHAQSLELMLGRAGFRTMSLSPVIEPSRMRRALRVLGPSAIVVTATRPSLDAIGRMIYAVRGAAPRRGRVRLSRRGSRRRRQHRLPAWRPTARRARRFGFSPGGAARTRSSVAAPANHRRDRARRGR